MSKKLVDVRLPAARAHAQKLDAHKPVLALPSLQVAAVHGGVDAQKLDRLSAKTAAALVEDLKVASLHVVKKPVATVSNEHNRSSSRPATSSRPGKDSGEEKGTFFSFTAGDMCAQLDVLSRPMYLLDSLVSAPKQHSHGSVDRVAAASTKHSQTPRVLAASALARVGSASRSESAVVASDVKGSGREGSRRTDTYQLNKLFALENGIQLSGSDEGGKLGASDAELEVSASAASAAAATGKGGPEAHNRVLAPFSDSSALSMAMLECDSEVMDVWVDESDGTTGSSNSTGLAARDLLHLSSLAHDCTKGTSCDTARCVQQHVTRAREL